MPLADMFHIRATDIPRWTTTPEDLGATVGLLAADLIGRDGQGAVDFLGSEVDVPVERLDIHRAAVAISVRRHRNEGHGIQGLVPHGILAAHSCLALGELLAAEAAAKSWLPVFQHVAYVCGSYRGGMRDPKHGPYWLADFDPAPPGECSLEAFRDAIAEEELDLADHLWLGLASANKEAAYEALVDAALAGYPATEHKLIFPAQTWLWAQDAGWRNEDFRGAVRYAANHPRDHGFREVLRRHRDSSVPSGIEEHSPDQVESLRQTLLEGTHVSGVESIAAALANGLDEEGVIEAASLASAQLYAQAPLYGIGVVEPLHATTGVNAVRHARQQVTSAELRRDLTLAAFSGRNVATLQEHARHAEPVVRRSVSDPAADLASGLARRDVAACREAVAGLDPADPETDRCWQLLVESLISDDFTFLHGMKQVVALRDDFNASCHPARTVYLEAAARTAAVCASSNQWVAPLAARYMHSGGVSRTTLVPKE